VLYQVVLRKTAPDFLKLIQQRFCLLTLFSLKNVNYALFWLKTITRLLQTISKPNFLANYFEPSRKFQQHQTGKFIYFYYLSFTRHLQQNKNRHKFTPVTAFIQ